MIKAILMDFNGVIINDEPLHMKAYQDVLKGEGIEMTEEEYYSCLGMDDRAYIRAAYERAEKECTDEKVLEIMDAKTARWREFVEEDVPLFEGAEDFIKKMDRDFALGIVSMARREEIEFVLEKTGLRRYFPTLVSAEDVSKHKPDPECYLIGFNLIDAARTARGGNPMVHRDCLVIEDSPQGIEAGRRAGLKTLGIPNTVEEQRLRAAGADSVSKGLKDWMPESVRQVFV
ncbi:MAG: HAD family phosphatase [Pyrinomonadaceae bacterium]